MHPLYTLAYPILAKADREFIDAFRDKHDVPFRDVVAPHFTQVFGCTYMSEDAFCSHIAQTAKVLRPIEFVCRYAMLGSNHADPIAHIFLVPDEGYSQLSLQHDRLYSGALAQYQRLDIPFTPHITIGTLGDRLAAKRLCDELNKDGLEIAGRVDTLTVAALVDGKIRDIASYPLEQ